jgi:V-type H+-transporting ATPase subunit a
MFGYMDFLIFVKWNTTYECNFLAPDIKGYLMNIFLKFGEIPSFGNITTVEVKDQDCQDYLHIKKGTHIDPEDAGKYDWILLADRPILEKIHITIFVLFILLIVIMLVPKILIDYCKIKKKLGMNEVLPQNILEQQNEENQVFQEDLMPKKNQNEEQQKGLSDLIVSASIETIEFVLGTVSNTASYLRLWALSLAHSQLAKVFFQETVILIGNISKNFVLNAFLLVIAFPAFAGVTALVLLFMDLMECFLHTLRLHWVEFQNKFYRADGYEFKPFCFAQSLDLKEDDFEKK